MRKERTFDEAIAEVKAKSNGGPTPAADPWEVPIPLGSPPAPVPFPLEVLPGPLADYVHECSWATNSPPDFAGVPLLAIAAGCTGAARSLGITRDHVQPATLFAVIVGLPGTGKSPALEQVSRPVEAAEARNYRRWRRARKRPQPRRLLVDDTTTEALVKTLHANQRGLLMIQDELSALVAGFNQYKEKGRGNDRQAYLKIWAGATIRVDRKSNEDGIPLVVRRPALSIVGGIQPDVVSTLLLDDSRGRKLDDGFLDRLLWSYPADLPAIEEQYREITPQAKDAWERSVTWLLSLKRYKQRGEKPRPKIVSLTPDGRDAWVEFTRRHAAELNGEDFADHLRGPWSKLRGYCGRLALVLHFLRMAVCDGYEAEEVSGQDVEGAYRLIDYFKAHYLRVAARMGADPRQQEAARVLGWLQRSPGVVQFSRRDAYAQLRRSFAAPEDLERPLGLLVQHGYLRAVEAAAAAIGRKPSQRFEVNPLWNRMGFVNSVPFVSNGEDSP